MNPINWVQALQGPVLILVICGLLFIEEVGVPLPFAPGDLILAIGGIAIAAGRVNAAVFVVAVVAATLIGAIIGRELFSLLGWRRLMRVAEPLHIRKPLEHASSLLHRSGWRAVFTARLVPGLRVHTTQIAGVSHVRRRTFLAGLVPATAVYVGAFVGLGVAFGRPILDLIHQAESQVLVAVALILALLIIFLLTRTPARRVFASLQAAGWTGPLRFSLDSVRLSVVLGSLGLNFAAHAIVQAFGLPLFLDSIGTILAGVVAGPWVGASVGVISNLVASNTVDPIAAPYAIVSFMVGFAAGLSRYLNWQKRPSGWISLWLVCFAIAALVSTPVNFLMSGGQSGVRFGDDIYAALNGIGLPRPVAAFVGEAAVDLPDKLLAVVGALLIAQGFGEQPMTSPAAAELNLREAFTFVIHSPRWLRRTLLAGGCLIFFWLVVPYLLFAGYIVEIAREVRAGRRQLPAWRRPGRKMLDGLKITLALLLWLLPTALLSIPAALISAAQQEPGVVVPGTISAITGIVAGIGSVWSLLVLVLEPPIISEFLARGFASAINPLRVARRLRINVGLTIVIGALVVVLTTLGVIGFLLFVVGVLLTLPYASFVGAYLVGIYAAHTDRPFRVASPAQSFVPRRGLVAETPEP